ncbi:hypothetical protein LJC31_07635 [Synergistaceae bacterium OttesenSCG-928-I11]|nr:hypothetical protein [Synergistaceae bacterium OttesenSCG-928-I11]
MKTKKMKAREGATLVMVVVIMLAGMALMGAAFYLHGHFVSRATASMGRTGELNDVDAAVEKGKMLLEDTIKDKLGVFPRRENYNDPTAKIQHVSDLLAYDGSNLLKRTYDGIEILIYDLDYASEDINASNQVRATLPPAMKTNNASYHAYLIKAIRARKDGLRDVVEVAIKAYKGN